MLDVYSFYVLCRQVTLCARSSWNNSPWESKWTPLASLLKSVSFTMDRHVRWQFPPHARDTWMHFSERITIYHNNSHCGDEIFRGRDNCFVHLFCDNDASVSVFCGKYFAECSRANANVRRSFLSLPLTVAHCSGRGRHRERFCWGTHRHSRVLGGGDRSIPGGARATR